MNVNPKMKMKPEIWIGLVSVVPTERNTSLGDGTGGAYVNVLGFALGQEDFEDKVKFHCKALGFEPLEIEDAEPFAQRISQWEVANELHALAREVENTGEFRFGTYHSFPAKGTN